MKRVSTIVLVVAISAALSLATVGAATARTRGAADTKPQATEIGVTPTTIRIAVVADVDSALAPGLFQGTVDAVNGAAEYINAQGGIGGRKLQVDFIDSKLNANDARNAIITACSQDFALVGTAALFLSNVDDEINCKDKKGDAIGLPDLGSVVFGFPQACSPVSYPVNVSNLICSTKDQTPQTYQGNQGDAKYFLQQFGKLHGAYVLPNDTKDVYRGIAVLQDIAVQAGIKADQSATTTGSSPQSAYTPIVQQMKTDGSNWAFQGGTYSQMIEFRQEAQLQGLTDPKIVWSCTTACYDPKFLQAGGDAVDGTYIPMAFLPFNETSSNKTLANFVKYVGKDKVTGLGVYGWSAALAFQKVLNDAVAKNGNNAITRQALLDGLAKLTNFDAGGMIGTTDVAGHVTSSCGAIVQVKGDKFVRVTPTKKGTFDCNPKNHVTVKADLR
jgi:ABC-type branched-subunit amino acid transport system substrate-binding protein